MISIEHIDEELLKIIMKKQWPFLREDFLQDFLKRFGIELEQWEMVTKCFYLAGTTKLKNGTEARIWKPAGDLTELLIPEDETAI